MISKTKSSWEFGTVAHALLELDNADLSVFGKNLVSTASSSISSLSFAKSEILAESPTLFYDSLSNADPASLGAAAVMLGKPESQFNAAAKRQLDTLLYNNPRTASEVISHRKASKEKWLDSVLMFPPFMAYYAASTKNTTQLKFTVSHLQLYRAGFHGSGGTWAQIAGGGGAPDPGRWSSGNGWPAMGMARTLATVLSVLSNDLTVWIIEIIDDAMALPHDSDGLLRNYLDNSSKFGKTFGTVLLAAVTYRMVVLSPANFGSRYTSWAKSSLDTVSRSVKNGIISPAVNPYSYRSNKPYTIDSPEEQAWAFVLHAAHRDCKC